MPFVDDSFIPDRDDRGSIRTHTLVGEYSVTKDRHVRLDTRQKRYLKEGFVEEGQCSLDVADGFDTFESWDEKNNTENIDVLLEYIAKKASPGRDLRQACCNSDFVCYRDTLTRIALYPFDHQDGFLISVVRYKSTIFLCQFSTEKKIEQLMNQDFDEELWTYYPFKFRQYATSKVLSGQTGISEPINDMEQFSLVYDTCLEGETNLRIFSSGEIDCFDYAGKPIGLKTEKLDGKKGFYCAIKHLRWWLQCYFDGADEVVVGLRTGSIVKYLERKQASELCGNVIKTRIMRSFLYNTLFLIKQELDSARQLEYFAVVFRHQGRSTLCPNVVRAPSKYHFLPHCFLDYFY